MDLQEAQRVAAVFQANLLRVEAGVLDAEEGVALLAAPTRTAGGTVREVLRCLDDRFLVVAIRNRVWFAEAFEVLAVERYEERMVGWFFNRQGVDELDLVQDMHISLLFEGLLRSFDISFPFAPWLRTVCRNRLIGELRRNGRMVPTDNLDGLIDPCPSPEDIVSCRDLAERLRAIIREVIPDPVRQRVLLGRLDGLSPREIAARESLEIGRVYRHSYHGFATLWPLIRTLR
jgi:RNA polymerase sigma factor (sigma-70 family)